MTDRVPGNVLNQHKFGLTFHRSFALVRPAVTSILKLAVEHAAISTDTPLTMDEIRQNTNLGTIYVEAMPRYAKAMGLVDISLRPTPFGLQAYEWDPLLEQPSTQWLMHYYMSAPYWIGPAFWHCLVVNRFRSGNEFSRDDISQQIAEFVSEMENREVTPRDADATATVFLGTYTKSDALGGVEILEEVNGHYHVLEPEPPPIWVMAYALVDFWLARFPQQISLNLNDLSGAGGLANLFMVGAGRLNAVLRTMQEEGYVEVHRVAPPYQVVLLNRDRSSLIERVYTYE
jgi:hypothetical protein